MRRICLTIGVTIGVIAGLQALVPTAEGVLRPPATKEKGDLEPVVLGGRPSAPQMGVGGRLSRTPGHSSDIIDIAFCRADHRLWTIDRTSLCQWNPRTFELERFFSESGEMKAICAANGTVIGGITDKDRGFVVIDVINGTRRKVPIIGDIQEIVPSPCGQFLLTRDIWGCKFDAWCLKSGKRLAVLKSDIVSFPVFFPDPQVVACNCQVNDSVPGHALCFWDLKEDRCIRQLRWPNQTQSGTILTDAVAVSRDGRWLFVIQEMRKKLRVIESATGDIAAEWPITCEIGPGVQMTLSPDRQWLAVPTPIRSDNYKVKVNLFAVTTGKCVVSLRTNARFQANVAFSPDSSILVSSGSTALIWNIGHLRKSAPATILSEEKQRQFWNDLDGTAKQAYGAINEWVDAPDSAVSYLRQALAPVPVDNSNARMDQLITQLGSTEYAKRELAERLLLQLETAVERPLLQFLESSEDPESKARARRILSRVQGIARRHDRAIEVLERIGNVASRKHLESLSQGHSNANLSVLAKLAIQRLNEQ